jgi:phosphohistidine phosphatase
MRHAEAESGMQMDPTRGLTDTGKRQSKMMGKWLARQNVPQPEILLQSNFRRSKATAKRMGEQLDLDPITCGFLDPENDPELVWPRIKALAKEHGAQAVLAVSHGPLVEKLLCFLTGSHAPQYVHFNHATIAHLDTTAGSRGSLHWMVSPNTVARDEDEMENVTSDSIRAVEAAIQVASLALEEVVA